MPTVDPISAMVQEFVSQIGTAIESAATDRVRGALAAAFDGSGGSKQAAFATPSLARASRPKQLCPVPGCTNAAAPVFGMVCAEHKRLSKAKIRQFREQRKAGAAQAPTGAAPAKRVIKVTPKLIKARKLQGRYLGTLRKLSAADKAKVKAVARDKGVPAALALAGSLSSKR